MDLKLSIYAQPDRPEEKALLIVDQARSSKDATVVQTMLDRASILILDSQRELENEPPPRPADLPDGEEGPGTLSKMHRERYLLWADIAKIAWKSRCTRTARLAGEQVMHVTMSLLCNYYVN